MRIFTWNVNSLAPTVRNIDLRHGSLAAFFNDALGADIVCLQEVKLPEPKVTRALALLEGWQSYWACSQGKTGYSGVTTWARVGCAALSAEADPFGGEGCPQQEGRALITDHGPFVLINVYVPNAGERPARARLPAKLAFLAALKARVDSLQAAGRQVIVVGDMNVAAEPRDVHGAITWAGLYDPRELTALHGLMAGHAPPQQQQQLGMEQQQQPGEQQQQEDGQQQQQQEEQEHTCLPGCSGLVDAWRRFHPHEAAVYTVWEEKRSSRAFNVGLRIDYALVSGGLMSKVTACEVRLDLPPKWSDHAPVVLDLQLQQEQPAAAPGAAVEGSGAGCSRQQQQQPSKPPECALWQQLFRRFNDPTQPSIASLFKAAAKNSKPAAAAPGGSSAQAAAVGAAGGSSSKAAAGQASKDAPQADRPAAAAGGEAEQPAKAATGSRQLLAQRRSADPDGGDAGGSSSSKRLCGGGVQQPAAAAATAGSGEQHDQHQQPAATAPSLPATQQQQQKGGSTSTSSRKGGAGKQPAKKTGARGKGAGAAAATADDPNLKQAKLTAFFSSAAAGSSKNAARDAPSNDAS